MKKTKKIIAVILTFVMVASMFVACKDKSSKKDSPKSEDITQVALEKVGTTAIKRLEKVESLHVSQTVDLSASMNGHAADINVNMESDISLVDEMVHLIGGANSNGLTMDMEMYIEKDGDNASIYANVNNSTWMKQNLKVADLVATQGYVDAYESAKYFLKALQGVEKSTTTYNGQSALLIKGVLDTEDPQGIFQNSGMGSAGEINTAMFQQMMTGLDAVDVEIYLDSATGLPLEIKLDMTAFMNSLYKNLGKLSGNSIPVVVDHAVGTMLFTDYNSVTVAVPDSVKSAVQ